VIHSEEEVLYECVVCRNHSSFICAFIAAELLQADENKGDQNQVAPDPLQKAKHGSIKQRSALGAIREMKAGIELMVDCEPTMKAVRKLTLVKYTCKDCEFCLKGNGAFYSCLKTEEGIMGIKETHPLYPVCTLFACKNISDLKSTGFCVTLAA
jgi:hypothetical protein